MGKRTVGCILLIAVIGLGWSMSWTSQESKDRTKVLEEFYSILINSSLNHNENQSNVTYALVKSLLTKNSMVNPDKLSILLEQNKEEGSDHLIWNSADITYEVGKEVQGMMGNQSEFAIPVTLIVEALLTDLLEEKEIIKRKKIITHIFFSQENNKWKISDFHYIDDAALLAF